MGSTKGSDKELTEPRNCDSRIERMRSALNAAFAPSALEILDDSSRHAGHAGAQPGGETHFTVKMTSAAFTGITPLARQRAVMAALKAEFDTGLHALSMDLKAP